MKITTVEIIAHVWWKHGLSTTVVQDDPKRIEIRTGTGVSYIITPENGELRISKQGSTQGLTVRPSADNVIRIH